MASLLGAAQAPLLDGHLRGLQALLPIGHQARPLPKGRGCQFRKVHLGPQLSAVDLAKRAPVRPRGSGRGWYATRAAAGARDYWPP